MSDLSAFALNSLMRLKIPIVHFVCLRLYVACLLLSIWITGCDLRRKEYKNTEFSSPQQPLPYDFDQPTKKYFLNEDLEEVSGLSWFGEDQIACVQDEQGRVFIYNLEDKKTTRWIKFGKGGDYEGIEVVDSTIYVLRSDGILFYFPLSQDSNDYTIEESSVRQFQVSVPGENDVEGLGYDPQRKQLLLAFKNKVDEEGKSGKDKPVYAISLTDTLSSNYPVWTITEKQLKQFFAHHAEEPGEEKGKKGKKGDWLAFKPSGIAVHPITRQVYLVASEGKKLVILSQKGEIQAVVKLSPRMLKQPEGICFAPNGDLYIASEGRGEDGFILKFAYQKAGSAR